MPGGWLFECRLPYNLPMLPEPLVVERVEKGILSLKGPLTTENLGLFQNALRREDASTMILDLAGVPYMDSSGLGSLVGAYVSLQKAGRRVVLTGANERVLKLFEMSRLESLFLIFPSLSLAAEALANAGNA